MFEPCFQITPALTRSLIAIELARFEIERQPIDVAVLAGLTETARLQTSHYSTQIEGNRLSAEQARRAVAGERFPGRERDVDEVRNYYRALKFVESLAGERVRIGEEHIRVLHGLAYSGRRRKSRYRDGQNVVRDGRTGGIVYLPPEAADVPRLMRELVAWTNRELRGGDLPPPIMAALVHLQLVAIHPWYDGNGRTARLLTTLVLHRAGFGIKGLYSLEEYYAQNLQGYYDALRVGPSHNYYEGRANADCTGFIEFFCAGMAESFSRVLAQTQQAVARGAADLSPVLRTLDSRQRRLLELFRLQATATTAEIAAQLGLSPRTVAPLCRQWISAGFLQLANPSRKSRSFRLAARFEQLVVKNRE